MKILVAFYSRSGNTRRVAEIIAKELGADLDEIRDKTDRSGIRGWLGGGRDAYFKKPTRIDNKKDPAKYDLVIIGTPVWAATQTPATRTYLTVYAPKKAAFFCTFGGSAGKTFSDMESLSSKPLATIGLRDREIEKSKDKIIQFCKEIR